MAGECEMIIGFLIPRRCTNRAVTQCAKCSRHFCEEHVDITHKGIVCTACQQGLDKPVLVAKAARDISQDDIDAFNLHAFDQDYDDNDIFADLS